MEEDEHQVTVPIAQKWTLVGSQGMMSKKIREQVGGLRRMFLENGMCRIIGHPKAVEKAAENLFY